MCFLPGKGPGRAQNMRRHIFERFIRQGRPDLIGWRDVPIDTKEHRQTVLAQDAADPPGDNRPSKNPGRSRRIRTQILAIRKQGT